MGTPWFPSTPQRKEGPASNLSPHPCTTYNKPPMTKKVHVTVWTHPGCGWCKKLVEENASYLSTHNVQVLSVAKNGDHWLSRHANEGVPVTILHDGSNQVFAKLPGYVRDWSAQLEATLADLAARVDFSVQPAPESAIVGVALDDDTGMGPWSPSR